jgi:hypothetical protein
MFPDEFPCSIPFPYCNGFEDKDDPTAVEIVRVLNEVSRKLWEGTLYIKFISGDRKGSIAKVKPNTKDYNFSQKEITIDYRRGYSYRPECQYGIINDSMYGICHWDGRKNSVKTSLYNREVVALLNYNGPTVWEKFDAKTAKTDVLANPEQHDIDGNMLNIGDKVLYINARYGSGFELCHGTIKEFTAKVDSRRTEIFTVVQNAENENQLSTISNSSYMIFKK